MIKVEAWQAEDGSLFHMENKIECEAFEDRLKTYELRKMLEDRHISSSASDIIAKNRGVIFNALSQYFA